MNALTSETLFFFLEYFYANILNIKWLIALIFTNPLTLLFGIFNGIYNAVFRVLKISLLRFTFNFLFLLFYYFLLHFKSWYSICLKRDKHFKSDQKFEQKLVYLRLLLSIFTNLLQIQFVIVADRRSSEHTFSRYHEALILAFPRFSSQTLLPFYATLKLGWKRNLDKDGIFVEGGGGQNSIVEKLKICKGNRKPGKRSWENRMKSPNVRKNFSPLSRRKMMTFHRIMQPWNFVRCRNYN